MEMTSFEQEYITLMPGEEQANPDSSMKSSNLECGKNVQVNETPENCGNGTPDDYGRRINRRDAEKKVRRQELATLLVSLRSKLPKEYVQGRSGSSDMHGAVKYINHLKETVDGLMKKRDELKKMADVGSSSTFDDEKTSVRVQCRDTGVQVTVKTSSTKGHPLSKFLSVLNGEGMPVVNCTSTRVNEALIHVIYCEVYATVHWKLFIGYREVNYT